MTLTKLRILKRVHNSHPSAPIQRADFLKKGKIFKYNRAIKELIASGYLKCKGNSDILVITAAGIDALEGGQSVLVDRWLTRTLSVIALILSLASILLQLC